MKLLPKEQKEIARLIDQFQLTEHIMLRKKKGWVFIEFEKQSFAFHRKSRLQLRDGKFENVDQYFTMEEQLKEEVTRFDQVLKALSEWLQKMEQQMKKKEG